VQLLTSLVVSFDQLFKLGHCCFVLHVRDACEPMTLTSM
jgi:hypothetical protein